MSWSMIAALKVLIMFEHIINCDGRIVLLTVLVWDVCLAYQVFATVAFICRHERVGKLCRLPLVLLINVVGMIFFPPKQIEAKRGVELDNAMRVENSSVAGTQCQATLPEDASEEAKSHWNHANELITHGYHEEAKLAYQKACEVFVVFPGQDSIRAAKVMRANAAMQATNAMRANLKKNARAVSPCRKRELIEPFGWERIFVLY